MGVKPAKNLVPADGWIDRPGDPNPNTVYFEDGLLVVDTGRGLDVRGPITASGAAIGGAVGDLSASYLALSRLGAPSAVPYLDGNGRLYASYIGDLSGSYIGVAKFGAASGVAALDQNAHLYASYIGDLSASYIALGQAGVASGVAPLDTGARVFASNLGASIPTFGHALLGNDQTFIQVGPTHYNAWSRGLKMSTTEGSNNYSRWLAVRTEMQGAPGPIYLTGGTIDPGGNWDLPHASGIIGVAGKYGTLIKPASTHSGHLITCTAASGNNAKGLYLAHFAIDMRNVTGSAWDAINLSATGFLGGFSSDGDQDFHQILNNIYITHVPRDGVNLSGRGESGVFDVHTYFTGRHGFNISTDSWVSHCTSALSDLDGFMSHTTPQRYVNNKAFYSGNRTQTGVGGAGFAASLAGGSGTLLYDGCEAQDNFGPGYHFIDNSTNTPINLIGCGADSNSTGTAGGYPALKLQGINKGIFQIVCLERQNPGTMLHALEMSTSHQNQISMTIKETGGGTTPVPIRTIDTSSIDNDIRFGAAGGGGVAVGNFASSYGPNPTNGRAIRGTLVASTFIGGPPSGYFWHDAEMEFHFLQDGTGGRVVTFDSSVYKLGSWTPSTNANAWNVIGFRYDAISARWKKTNSAEGL